MTDMDPFDAKIMVAVDATVAACREEIATLRVRVAELEAALRECSQGADEKGESCWCCIPSMIPYRGHDAGCEAARAALSSPPAHDGEGE